MRCRKSLTSGRKKDDEGLHLDCINTVVPFCVLLRRSIIEADHRQDGGFKKEGVNGCHSAESHCRMTMKRQREREEEKEDGILH